MRERPWKLEWLTKWTLPRSPCPFFLTKSSSGVDKECGKQIVSSLESEQSVNLDDDELQSFLEQQKNCNTQKKTLSDLRTRNRWCKGIKESRKIEDIPPKEMDRLLGHFYCKVRSAKGSLYEPSSSHFHSKKPG